MGTQPDELKSDVEDTRAHLAHNVDRLADKVTPGKVARRKADNTQRRITRVKERVMGAASDTTASGTQSVADTAGQAGEAVKHTADQVSFWSGCGSRTSRSCSAWNSTRRWPVSEPSSAATRRRRSHTSPPATPASGQTRTAEPWATPAPPTHAPTDRTPATPAPRPFESGLLRRWRGCGGAAPEPRPRAQWDSRSPWRSGSLHRYSRDRSGVLARDRWTFPLFRLTSRS